MACFPPKLQIPFARLLQQIIHEILIAHQYDIWGPDPEDEHANKGIAHLDVLWFDLPQQSSPSSPSTTRTSTEDLALVVDRLRPWIEKWVEAFGGLRGLSGQMPHDIGTYKSKGFELGEKEGSPF